MHIVSINFVNKVFVIFIHIAFFFYLKLEQFVELLAGVYLPYL